MMYIFYVFGLISFVLSNLSLFLAIHYNFSIGLQEALMLSSSINGLIYGAIFRWVVTTSLLNTIEELLSYIHPIHIEVSSPRKAKGKFTDEHKEKLRQSSLKRTRDANGRFK